MHHRIVASVMVVLSVAGGCSTRDLRTGGGQVLPEEQKRAVAAAVDSAMHAYLAAVAARDADKVVGFYANDPEFMAYIDGSTVNYDGQVRAVRGVFAGVRALAFEPGAVKVTVVGPDAAIAAFSFQETLTDTTGKEIHLRGTASWTWTRSSGGWLILHGDGVHLPVSTNAQK